MADRTRRLGGRRVKRSQEEANPLIGNLPRSSVRDSTRQNLQVRHHCIADRRARISLDQGKPTAPGEFCNIKSAANCTTLTALLEDQSLNEVWHTELFRTHVIFLHARRVS